MKKKICFNVLILFVLILFAFQASAQPSFTRNDVIGEWHLNESSGTNAPDTAGTNDGILTNMEDGDWVVGKLNNALEFDSGFDEFVNLGNTVGDFNRFDTYSYEFWFQTASSNPQYILSKQEAMVNQRGWSTQIASGKLTAELTSVTSGNRLLIETVSLFDDNVFHHAVITYNGNSDVNGLIIYVDSLAQATTTITNALIGSTTNATNAQISGRDGINETFIGIIDEVVIYDVTLTAADVNDSFNGGVGLESHPPSFIDLNVTHPNGGEFFDPSLVFNIDINFTLESSDSNSALVDINFSTTSTQGTGTVIIDDVNTDSATIVCEDADFTDKTNCTFTWSLNNVADNNYFILISARDGFSINFDTSDSTFEIFSDIPVVNVTSPNGGETFDKKFSSTIPITFNVRDSDANVLAVDINFSTSSSQGTGTAILTDVNTNTVQITCDDADFIDQTDCSFTWDISAVADNNYFILILVKDLTKSDFDTSDSTFQIFTTPDTEFLDTNYTQYFSPNDPRETLVDSERFVNRKLIVEEKELDNLMPLLVGGFIVIIFILGIIIVMGVRRR